MTLKSQNSYIHKLDNIVNTHKNTYHSTIKTKPVDKSSRIFCKKEISDDKLKNLNKKVTSNKKKACTGWKWIKCISKKSQSYQQKN